MAANISLGMLGAMSGSVEPIPIANLSLAFAPTAVVLAILYRWSAGGATTLHAVGRMVLQLAVVGYALTFLFGTERGVVVLVTLTIMLAAAGWIALRPVARRRRSLYPRALTAIGLGGVSTLVIITQGVLTADPWHEATVLIPLGGMIFAASMNAVSLSAERFQAERTRGTGYDEARRVALQAALIPQINTLFAVGLVSLPGMMTGQILSGVPPLVAARYQIMVMCMLFGAAGISAWCYLALQREGAVITPPGHQQR